MNGVHNIDISELFRESLNSPANGVERGAMVLAPMSSDKYYAISAAPYLLEPGILKAAGK
jgi:hypothetical protein